MKIAFIIALCVALQGCMSYAEAFRISNTDEWKLHDARNRAETARLRLEREMRHLRR